MNKSLTTPLILRYILAAVFITSAITKLIAPGLFEIIILNEGIISTREIAAYIARFLLITELFIGIALLQPYYLKQLVLPATFISLVGFIIILLNSILIGNNGNCGCFGEIIKMSPIEAIVKNIFLIIIGIFIYFHSESKRQKLYIPFTLLVISGIFVLTVAPLKSHLDLRFSKYTNFSDNQIVDLNSGDKLVAIFYIDCEHCMEAAKEIVELEKTSRVNNFYIFFSGENTDSVSYFLKETKIQHPYIRIPTDDFFELIGNSPPRFYWLKNGNVYKYWDEDIITNIKTFINFN